MKTCTKCKTSKSLDSFNKKRRAKDGLCFWCKACKKEHDGLKQFKPNYDGSKECSVCRKMLSRSSFYLCKRMSDGLENRCKDCCKERSRTCDLKSKYNMNESEYDEMFRDQNGVCKICGTSDPGGYKNKMSIDHCHNTGKIRGLLCSSCNFAIGLMKDDVGVLANAIAYLEKCNEQRYS